MKNLSFTSIKKQLACLSIVTMCIATVPVPQVLALAVSDLIITSAGATTANAGDPVTFSFSVENTSSDPAVFYFDNMGNFPGHTFVSASGGDLNGCAIDLSGALQCNGVNIAGNTTVTYDFVFDTTAPDACGSPSITAEITEFGTSVNTNTTNDSAVSTATVNCAPPPSSPIVECNGLTATIYVQNGVIIGGSQSGSTFNGTILGTNGDDVIVGTDGPDTILARDGNDTVCGFAGDDDLRGEAGNDYILGGDDNDDIKGGTGDDEIYGENGDDTINANEDNDTVRGGPGEDTVSGAAGNDFVCGDEDNDKVYGQDGDDTLCGGEGDDIMRGGNGNDKLDGGDGTDSLDGDPNSDICINGETVVNCEDTTTLFTDCSAHTPPVNVCTPNNANLVAYWNFDEGTGTIANDATSFNNVGTLLNGTTWSSDAPPLVFTNQFSTVFDGSNDAILANDSTGLNFNASDEFSISAWVKQSSSTSGYQTIVHTINDNVSARNGYLLTLNNGVPELWLINDFTTSNYLVASADSAISSTVWHNIVVTYDGSSTATGVTMYVDGVNILVNPTVNTLTSNSLSNEPFGIGARAAGSIQQLQGSLDEIRVYNSELNATQAAELASGICATTPPVPDPAPMCNGSTATIYVNNSNIIVGGPNNGLTYSGTLLGTSNDDIIVGTPNDDTIQAEAGNDTICSLGGNDTIDAGDGNDWVEGGPGNDTIDGKNGNDTLYGGNDDDIINGGGNADEIHGQAGNDTLRGGAGPDQIFGAAGNDTIDGQAGPDVISGGDGDDIINGGSGPDEIDGNAGEDTIRGNAGDDTLSGGNDNDFVCGDEDNDTINGNGGDDIICGGDGNDVLQGGNDNDKVDGGLGVNTLQGNGGSDICINGTANGTCEDTTTIFTECSTHGGNVTYDFGDAPLSYQTVIADNGAAHIIIPGFLLGSEIDAELNGQPTVNADGDDTFDLDDENGVTISTLEIDAQATITVDVANSANVSNPVLQGWIDWNQNGTFDPSELVINNESVTNGTNTFQITVPNTATTGNTYARFRLSTIDNIAPHGVVANGEVEDYAVTVEAAAGELSLTNGSVTTVNAGSATTLSLVVENTANTATEFNITNIVVPNGYTFTGASGGGITNCMVNMSKEIVCDALTISPNSTITYEFTFDTAAPNACGTSQFTPILVVISGTDNSTKDNTDTINSTVECPDALFADVLVSSGSAITTTYPNSVTYEFMVQNTGTGTATVFIEDLKEPGGLDFVSATGLQNCSPNTMDMLVCDTITVPGKSTVSFSLEFSVENINACGLNEVTATADVQSGFNTVATNDSATAEATIGCGPDLAISQIASNNTPTVGSSFTIEYTVENIGTETATSIVVNAPVPANYTLQSGLSSTGTYTSISGEWEIPELIAGDTETLTLTLVPQGSEAGVSTTTSGEITNSSPVDPNSTNNIASTTITPQAVITPTVTTTTSGGGGSGGRRGANTTAISGIFSSNFAPGAFGGTDPSPSCLEFNEASNTEYNDIAAASNEEILKLWEKTVIQNTTIAPVPGFNGEDVFRPDVTLNRVLAAQIILGAHCTVVPNMIPVPEDGFEFKDLPLNMELDDPRYEAATIMYTAYINGFVKGTKEGFANPYNEIILAEALAMMIRLDQLNITDSTGRQWFTPYMVFAQQNNLLPNETLLASSTLNREEFIVLLTNSIRLSIHSDLRDYVTRRLEEDTFAPGAFGGTINDTIIDEICRAKALAPRNLSTERRAALYEYIAMQVLNSYGINRNTTLNLLQEATCTR